MQSLIAKTKTFLTPSQSSSSIHKSRGFRTEKSATALFSQTDPKVDGEDCLHDCASCTETLPRKWSIDEEDKLYGHVNGWDTHIVIGTGKTDWVRDIIDEKGSLMQAVGKQGLELKNGKLMLSASDMPSGHCATTHHSVTGGISDSDESDYPDQGRTRCLILPRWEMVENIGVNDAKWLLKEVIEKGNTNTTPLSPSATNSRNGSTSLPGSDSVKEGELVVQRESEPSEEAPDISGLTLTPSQQQRQSPDEANNNVIADLSKHSITTSPYTGLKPKGVTLKPCPHRAVILMCSHGTRDWRCGKSAPILRREFERHLRPLGLYRDFDDDRPGGVGVYFINHVGGHKYSANVMIYRRQGTKKVAETDEGVNGASLSKEAVQGIWLARVRPEDCENIIKYTVLQGKLLKPQSQLRGGFDRERGLLSW
jgi:hypothetical protein